MTRRLLVILALAGGSAWAGPTLKFTLDTDHCTGGCAGGPPYGTITLTDLGSGTVNVLISLTTGIKFVGNPPSFAFNLIGNPTIAVTGLNTGWSLESTAAGAIQMDGFADFEYAVNCDVCGSGASNPQPGPISFNVTATGLDTLSFKEVSKGGTPPAYMAADVTGTNKKTGIVGAVGPPVIVLTPEPTSIALFGTTAGVFLFTVLYRRRSLKPRV